jgi:hypothetical protein
MSPALAAAYGALLTELLDTFDAVDRAALGAHHSRCVTGAATPVGTRIPDKRTPPRVVGFALALWANWKYTSELRCCVFCV